MKTLKTLSLCLATALFTFLASCGGSAPKDEAKEVVQEVEEVVEAPVADSVAVVDTAAVAVDSVAAEEPAAEEETEM